MSHATPWCQRLEDGTFTEHQWIDDTNGPVCTNCGDTLADWKEATRPRPDPDDGYWLERDGRPIAGPFNTWSEALGDFHRRASYSYDHGHRHEGWNITEPREGGPR